MEFFRYLKSECYRTAHRKVLYGFTGGCILVIFLLLLFCVFSNQGIDEAYARLHLEDLLPLLSSMVPTLGMYAVLFTAHVAFGDEHKQQTLKNSVSSGVPRGTIYFGKLTTAFLYSVLVLAAIFLAVFGLGALMLGVWDGEDFLMNLRGLFWSMLGSLPLWLGALSLAILLFTRIRSGAGASFLYLGAVTLIGWMLSLLELIGYSVFGTIHKWLISTQLGNICYVTGFDSQLLAGAWISGLLYTLVFSAAGWLMFRKMEIK